MTTALPMKIHFEPVSETHEMVATWMRSALEAKATRLNKRLRRLGVAEVELTFGPVVEVEERREITGLKYVERFFEFVTVSGVRANVDGWVPVASLDHSLTEDEALVSRFPGQEDTEIPERFRFRGAHCDHCRLDRRRSLTVLFRHPLGHWAQVGRTCVEDFFGLDPRLVDPWRVWLTDDEAEEEYERTGRHVGPAPITFLTAAEAVTRKFGFVPSRPDDPRAMSTREDALNFLAGPGRAHRRELWFARYGDVTPDTDRAERVADWVNAQEGAGEYIANAKVALRADEVTHRTQGLLASLPHAFERAQQREAERQAEREARAASYHVGEIGERIEGHGTVTAAVAVETNFGVSMRVVVRSPEGPVFTTFGSGRTLFEIERGDEVEFRGTVSEHIDHERFGIQTELKRVKFTTKEEA